MNNLTKKDIILIIATLTVLIIAVIFGYLLYVPTPAERVNPQSTLIQLGDAKPIINISTVPKGITDPIEQVKYIAEKKGIVFTAREKVLEAYFDKSNLGNLGASIDIPNMTCSGDEYTDEWGFLNCDGEWQQNTEVSDLLVKKIQECNIAASGACPINAKIHPLITDVESQDFTDVSNIITNINLFYKTNL